MSETMLLLALQEGDDDNFLLFSCTCIDDDKESSMKLKMYEINDV